MSQSSELALDTRLGQTVRSFCAVAGMAGRARIKLDRRHSAARREGFLAIMNIMNIIGFWRFLYCGGRFGVDAPPFDAWILEVDEEHEWPIGSTEVVNALRNMLVCQFLATFQLYYQDTIYR